VGWKLTTYNYGAEATVIAIINATAGDTNALRVPRALAQAEALIDEELKNYTNVPVGSKPQLLVDCANDWAAGIARDEDINPTSLNPSNPPVFTKRAKEALCRYLAREFAAPCPWAEQLAQAGGGGGGATPEIPIYSRGILASSRYKTDDIKRTWNEE
jgi:hypothetical protein